VARTRNYAAEYARRVQRGLARGLSRTEARGHPEERVGRPGREPLLGIKAAEYGYLPARSYQPKRYRIWWVQLDDPTKIVGTEDKTRFPGDRIGEVDADPFHVIPEYGEDIPVARIAAITVGPWRRS